MSFLTWLGNNGLAWWPYVVIGLFAIGVNVAIWVTFADLLLLFFKPPQDLNERETRTYAMMRAAAARGGAVAATMILIALTTICITSLLFVSYSLELDLENPLQRIYYALQMILKGGWP